jgi:hypothetical protein
VRRIYLAGPMSGKPYFNFPAFMEAARKLRLEGSIVFNPAQQDIDRHGVDVSADNPTGDSSVGVAAMVGLNIRQCLKDDLSWICENATHIALLPGWEQSKGARAEHATAQALGLSFIYL